MNRALKTGLISAILLLNLSAAPRENYTKIFFPETSLKPISREVRLVKRMVYIENKCVINYSWHVKGRKANEEELKRYKLSTNYVDMEAYEENIKKH